jgi:voltage-gated potassium channel
MQNEPKFQELKDASYEFFIVAISILAVVNLIIILIVPIEEMDEVLRIVNIAISILFLVDFFYRLLSAPSKRGYLFKSWGWLDFLGSLPFMGAQILRLLRAIRIIRLMREYGRSALSEDVRKNRAGSALASASLLVILVLQFGSYLIIGIESKSPQANIVDPLDALWWSVVTIATVGYGDQYPVTIQGRLIGTVIIISGVFLFTVLTGFLAKKFFSKHEVDENYPEDSGMKLENVQNMLEQQNGAIAALQEQLNRIENQINPD